MVTELVVHRDLKLANIMLHFPGQNGNLMEITKEQKFQFLQECDLTEISFEIKLTDYGLSKKLDHIEQMDKLFCGTLMYMAP